MNAERFVQAARALIGSPFMHQGRLAGIALDCIGVPMVAGRSVGLLEPDFEFSAYAREPSNGLLPLEMAKKLLVVCSSLAALPHKLPVSLGHIKHGDILLFRFLTEGQHVGVYNAQGSTIIHAYQPIGRCVEHGLDGKWQRRLAAVFRFPQLWPS